MSTADLVKLDDFGKALSEAGYTLAYAKLADHPALLAETPYAFVGIVEVEGWDGLADLVSDTQADLTHCADDARSARDWDLYLMIHMLRPDEGATHHALIGTIEADTRYTRKLVRIAISKDRLDSALRPLLPLRPAAQFDLAEPLSEMRDELRRLNLDDAIADTAISAFRRDQEVEVL